MSLLAQVLGGIRSLSPSPTDDYWYMPRSSPTASGQCVDENTALNYSAVWCASRILAEGVAGLPCLLYERLSGGGKARASNELLYGMLHDEPNDETDAFQFFDQMQAWLVNWGNARAEIQRNGAGKAIALWPIHPTRIPPGNVRRDAAGKLVFWVRNNNGPDTQIPDADMLNVVGPISEDGVTGKGAIAMARESIGMGLATERYGAAFFGKGATPSGVITHPGKLKDEARKNMRRSWKELYGHAGGGNEVAILEEGVKFEKVSIPPEDAQFLQTRQHNITEIARWYRIPPHMLADLSRATYSNIEQQGIDFVVYSLRPWLCRWEKALSRKLLLPDERKRFVIEFLVDALLRGDAAARSSALQIQFMNGAINQDEWREIENRNPLPDGLGQTFYRPQNLASVEAPSTEAEAEPAATDSQETVVDQAAPPTDQASAAASADIQATALNGAQIASMIQVAQLTVDETFSQDAARGMLAAAFPLLTTEQINDIVDNLTPIKKEETPNADDNAVPGSNADGATVPPDATAEAEPETEAEGSGGAAKESAAAIVKQYLADTEGRLSHREAKDALLAARHPQRFLGWLDLFYERHEKFAEELFAQVVEIGTKSGCEMASAKWYAHDHCERHRQELLTASECSQVELMDSVRECVDKWRQTNGMA